MTEAVKIEPNHSKRSMHSHAHHTICDSLMRYAEYLGFGEIHTKIDAATGLKAIIAIHNLKRGPAIGGCRLYAYQTMDKAYEDAFRLAHMMSFKAAINNLPNGGAKAVLIKPKIIKDREAYFEKFGEFVNELGGRYITAVDSGTNTEDMDIVFRRTPFVTCTATLGDNGDPSPCTALGVRRAIEAAVKFKLQRDSIEGVHVIVQGVGHVGYFLTKELVERGARVTVADVNTRAVEQCVEEFKVNVCPPEDVYDIEADVFSPCALGAILNLKTINRLKVKIVAGSANNQLAHHHYDALLQERGILYAPDFLINAGGLIHVAVLYNHRDLNKSYEQINTIYHTVYDIFERAAVENLPPNVIAERIARDRLGQ